jgi:hypothetical protein
MKLLMLTCLLLALSIAGKAQQSPIPEPAATQLGDQCRQCGQVDAFVAREFAESRMGGWAFVNRSIQDVLHTRSSKARHI